MTLPPFLRREGKHAVGAAGRASETRLARRLAGKQTPASGAMVGAKGDVVLPAFLVEGKSTTNASMSLQLDWLAKITTEARGVGKEPALAIQFTTGDGRPVKFGSWVMVPEALWKEITDGKD